MLIASPLHNPMVSVRNIVTAANISSCPSCLVTVRVDTCLLLFRIKLCFISYQLLVNIDNIPSFMF